MPKKLEEIRKAIQRENPSVDKDTAYAMARNQYNKLKRKGGGKSSKAKKN